MPRITLTTENKSSSAFDYPKLMLDKGERARIVCIEPDPLYEYVHTLRAPQLINGKLVMETIRNRDGNEQQVPKYDFVGRHICIGAIDVISEKGVDVKGCPVCKASTESDAVRQPERRFAMHVIRYKIQPGSFDVAEPFGVDIVAWVFGDSRFNTIVDFNKEWSDLRKHDLLLGPCENKQFQKYDAQVASKAEWLGDDARKKLTLETYEKNKSKDLSPLIGRSLSREQVQDDLDRVLTKHRQAFGGAAPEEDEPPPWAVTEDKVDLGELTSEPVAAAVEQPEPEQEKVELDFDDLLKGV